MAILVRCGTLSDSFSFCMKSMTNFNYLFLVCVFLGLQMAQGTIIAAKCTDGILLGYDSLETMGGSTMVSQRYSQKVHRVNPTTFLCFPTESVESHLLCKDLRTEARSSSRGYSVLSTKALSHCAHKLIQSKYQSTHAIIVGCEGTVSSSEPEYRIFEILPGGTIMERDMAMAGTGADGLSMILGDIGDGKKSFEDTNVLVQKALKTVRNHDMRTGGNLRINLLRSSAQSSMPQTLEIE